MQAKSAPEDWRTTSDSIAALMALEIGAIELVLLKSTLPTEFNSNEFRFIGDETSWLQWAQSLAVANLVDEHFSDAGRRLILNGNTRLSIVNFRESQTLQG